MKHLLIAACFALPLPATAQEAEPVEEGFSLMEEGARMLLRGLMEEMEPAMDDLSGMADEVGPALELLASEMGPALMELYQTLDSIRYYEAPEILPNGDIIIRRSPDAPVYAPADPEGVIDL